MSTFITSLPKKGTIGSGSDDFFSESIFRESKFESLKDLISHYNRINDLKKILVGIIGILIGATALAGIFELWF